MRYTHLPNEVEAVQWLGNNIGEIQRLVGPNVAVFTAFSDIVLVRKDGNRYPVALGAWVIKRDSGCVYSCSEESFEMNYDSVPG